MSFGLEIMDPAGDVQLSADDRIVRIIGVYVLPSSSAVSRVISVPGFRLDGTWGCVCSNTWVDVIPANDQITVRKPSSISGAWFDFASWEARVLVFRF